MSRIVSTALFLFLMCTLSACAAPKPADVASAAPPKSTPYPPRAMPKSVAVDSTCKTSADCAVKDVGNCCGAMPACVNKDSPTDPAAVQAQCQAKGMMGVCGFREVSACQCDNGQCVEVPSQSDLRGPLLPADEVQ
ncbi:MAG: hypothetical protein ABI538_08000 [Pseudoxanthomonas sp.]